MENLAYTHPGLTQVTSFLQWAWVGTWNYYLLGLKPNRLSEVPINMSKWTLSASLSFSICQCLLWRHPSPLTPACLLPTLNSPDQRPGWAPSLSYSFLYNPAMLAMLVSGLLASGFPISPLRSPFMDQFGLSCSLWTLPDASAPGSALPHIYNKAPPPPTPRSTMASFYFFSFTVILVEPMKYEEKGAPGGGHLVW